MAADHHDIVARAKLKPLSDAEFRRLLGRLATIAERTTANTIDAILEAIVDNQVVALVWGDAREPGGVNYLIIRGGAVLREIVAAGPGADPIDVDVGAIWVSGPGEAQRLGERFAEVDQRQ
jgi:hypothetical protein